MTSIHQEAPRLDRPAPPHADASGPELRAALVTLAVALAAVASAVAIVVIPQADPPLACRMAPAQDPSMLMAARRGVPIQ